MPSLPLSTALGYCMWYWNGQMWQGPSPYNCNDCSDTPPNPPPPQAGPVCVPCPDGVTGVAETCYASFHIVVPKGHSVQIRPESFTLVPPPGKKSSAKKSKKKKK